MNPLGKRPNSKERISQTATDLTDPPKLKVKPISRTNEGAKTAATKGKDINVAESLLKNTSQARREADDKAFQKGGRRNLDEEIKDMLNIAKNSKAAIEEINDAFSGNYQNELYMDERTQKFDLKRVRRQKSVNARNPTAPNKPLDSIQEGAEQEERNEEYALVPVTYGN